jgi:hypothetical protein
MPQDAPDLTLRKGFLALVLTAEGQIASRGGLAERKQAGQAGAVWGMPGQIKVLGWPRKR